jgi:chorismate synthase
LRVDPDFINAELRRRQMGFGRGARMKIEKDSAEIYSGVRKGLTTGGPLCLFVKNKDFRINNIGSIFCPRPGHADLAGYLKYGLTDIRDVLERASARSTAATVAAGAACGLFLREFGIKVKADVVSIGGESFPAGRKRKVTQALERKDTVGGVFCVTASGVPVGLGSYCQQDRRLDARLAAAVIAIPGIKAVEFGLGFGYAEKFGSQVHDQIYHSPKCGYYRSTNNAGGMEGGISNGEEIVIRACMKPIATLLTPLDSVDVKSRKAARAAVERSDICAVEPASVVAEAAVELVLAGAFLEKFAGDHIEDTKLAYKAYLKRVK